jgi:hypothetical protein
MEKVVRLDHWKKGKNGETIDEVLENPASSPVQILDVNSEEPPHRTNVLALDMTLFHSVLPKMTKAQSKRIKELFAVWNLNADDDLYRVVRRAVNCELDLECDECPYEEKCMDLSVIEAAAIIILLENPGKLQDDTKSKSS